MTFICDQNWDAMKPTTSGRYCDICKKEVFDFTNKTVSEVNKLDKGICGIFLPEHVEDGLTPIKLNFVSRAKYYAATIATIFGLETQTLNAQNSNGQRPKTEAVADTLKNNSSVTFAPTDSSAINDDCLEKNDPLADKTPFMRIGRRNFYWTKSFPFIASRRRWVMGARF